jgi:hypothetical protein
MSGRIFRDVIDEKSNVKMGKTEKRGGGGHSGVKREGKIVEMVGFSTFFP